MNTTNRRIIGAILVLSVLGLIVPGVRADDPIDRANEIGRYQAELWQDAVKQNEETRNWAVQQQQEAAAAWQQPPAAQPAAPVAAPPQAPMAPQVAAPQVPPAGSVPAFRLQIFNGAAPTDVTYYRDASGQLRFTSPLVPPTVTAPR